MPPTYSMGMMPYRLNRKIGRPKKRGAGMYMPKMPNLRRRPVNRKVLAIEITSHNHQCLRDLALRFEIPVTTLIRQVLSTILDGKTMPLIESLNNTRARPQDCRSLNIAIEYSQHTQLKILAAKQGLTLSDIVRAAIQHKLIDEYT